MVNFPFETKNFIRYAVFEIVMVLLLTGWCFIRSYIVLDGDFLGLDTMSRAQEKMSLATGIIGRQAPMAEGITVAQFVADPFIWASLVFSYIGQYVNHYLVIRKSPALPDHGKGGGIIWNCL